MSPGLEKVFYLLAVMAAGFCLVRGFTACAHRPPCMSGFDLHADAGVDQYGDRYTGGGITIYFDTTGACVVGEWEEKDDD